MATWGEVPTRSSFVLVTTRSMRKGVGLDRRQNVGTCVRPFVRNALVLLLAACWFGIAGCAFHSDSADLLVGPVFLRTSSATAEVRESVHPFGVLEIGSTTGIAVGPQLRTIICPRDESEPVGTTSYGSPAVPTFDGWSFSPIFTRIEVPSPTVLMRRVNLGAGLQFGSEARCAFVGWRASTVVTPPQDAFLLLEFRTSDPRAARCGVWRDVLDAKEEIDRWNDGEFE